VANARYQVQPDVELILKLSTATMIPVSKLFFARIGYDTKVASQVLSRLGRGIPLHRTYVCSSQLFPKLAFGIGGPAPFHDPVILLY